MKKLPILELPNNEKITSLFPCPVENVLLIGTSHGRILRQTKLSKNVYGTGARMISTQMTDGYGNFSPVFMGDLFYAFHDQIVQVNEDKNIASLKNKILVLATSQNQEMKGLFTSPILWGGNDFGYWESIYIEQNCPDDCETEFFLRTAAIEVEVAKQNWLSVYKGREDTKELAFDLRGNYLQIKAELSTDVNKKKPYIYKIIVSYRTKHAVYFFTNKFSLERDTNLARGLFSASYIQPAATEIRFGITSENTSDWDQYTILDLDQVIDLPEGIQDSFKIGIKLISASTVNSPTVDEFAFVFEGAKKNQLNSGQD